MGAQYSVLCREDGGVLDDLFTYRLGVERYLTVTNASNHLTDLAWFNAHAADFPEATVEDRIEEWAMLAVQGTLAREIVQSISDSPLPAADERRDPAPRRSSRCWSAGPATQARTASSCSAAPMTRRRSGTRWSAAGPSRPVWARATPCVWRSCFHLYGNDLSFERGPIEAGLGWCCKEDTGFIGSDAVRAVREAGPAEKLVAFEIDGPGIARQGNAVVGGGSVTSGTLSPCLEHRDRPGLRARRSRPRRHPSGDRRPGSLPLRGRRPQALRREARLSLDRRLRD